MMFLITSEGEEMTMRRRVSALRCHNTTPALVALMTGLMDEIFPPQPGGKRPPSLTPTSAPRAVLPPARG